MEKPIWVKNNIRKLSDALPELQLGEVGEIGL
jgi:hypothetical protein